MFPHYCHIVCCMILVLFWHSIYPADDSRGRCYEEGRKCLGGYTKPPTGQPPKPEKCPLYSDEGEKNGQNIKSRIVSKQYIFYIFILRFFQYFRLSKNGFIFGHFRLVLIWSRLKMDVPSVLAGNSDKNSRALSFAWILDKITLSSDFEITFK